MHHKPKGVVEIETLYEIILEDKKTKLKLKLQNLNKTRTGKFELKVELETLYITQIERIPKIT